MRKSACSQPAHQLLDVFIVKIAQHAGYRVLNVHTCFIAAASIYALSSVGLEFKNIFHGSQLKTNGNLYNMVYYAYTHKTITEITTQYTVHHIVDLTIRLWT